MRELKAALCVFILLLSSGYLRAQVKHKRARSTHSSLVASIARGKTTYMGHCITCHQADGSGVPNMNPPLKQTSYVLGDKIKLITIVLNGFNEDVEINGQTYSNSMPPHAFLKDQEIADVLTFVRNNFGNKASAVMVKQVITTRKSSGPSAP